jgi:hypothetical protein
VPKRAGPAHAVVAVGLALVGLFGCAGHSPDRPDALRGPVVGFHVDLATFLERHHREGGRIDYAAAVSDSRDLDRYLARLRAVSPDSDPLAFPSDPQRLAYWINAYNAWTIRFVLDHYPIASVNDVRPPTGLGWLPQGAGFFYFLRTDLGGRRWNLYDLENRLMRRRFDEPRIHFALNCASIGCPELPGVPFVAHRLEAQLVRETTRFLADATQYRLDAEAGVVWLSPIFDWYESDFTRWARRHHPQQPATLVTWLLHHLPPHDAQQLATCEQCRVEFGPYDWSLNDVR